MTGWIPDVVTDQVIASAWGNQIRDRTATPFSNAAARTAGIPTPKPGMLTWLVTEQRLDIWNGTAWQSVDGGREIGHAQITANTGNFAASPGGVIAGLSVTVAMVPGRRYYVEQWGTLNAATDAVGYLDTIVDGVGNVPLARASMFGQRNAAGGENRSYSTRARYTVATAGNHTFAAWGLSTGGALYVQAGSGNPAMLTVIDMGGV